MNRKILQLPILTKQLLVASYAQIRPYRQGGFRIQKQILNNKNIYHNYGHGGSGVSWSYGSAVRCVDLFMKDNKENGQECAVIGSGIIGLLTALQLVNRNQKVTIYSKSIPQKGQKDNSKMITSEIAPGFWFPYDYLDLQQLDTMQISRTTMKFLKQSIATKKYKGLRVSKVYDKIFEPSVIQKFSQILPQRSSECQVSFNSQSYTKFRQFSTISIDMQVFLQQLICQLTIKNVTFSKKQFTTQSQLSILNQNHIFNCTGYGSKYLFSDNMMKPMRGHLLQFRNVDFQKFYFIVGIKISNGIVRIYNHQARILLGLTKQLTEEIKVQEDIVETVLRNYNEFYHSYTQLQPKL